jgi:hypothetical protein
MTPATALLLYLGSGMAYAGALVAMMVRDRVPLARFVVWYSVAQVVAFWPIVLAWHGWLQVKRALKRRGYGSAKIHVGDGGRACQAGQGAAERVRPWK